MGKLVVISGPSGVGKGTVVKLLQEKYKKENQKLYLSISCTTRSPREGEQEGISYYFITEEEFKDRIEKNDFLEYNQYGTGKFYGTPKSTVLKYLEEGYDVILEIDINGYRQIKKNFKDTIGIFVTLENIDAIEERLRSRGTETEEQIQNRMNTARSEVQYMNEYDYIVYNHEGEAENTMEEIYGIMKK